MFKCGLEPRAELRAVGIPDRTTEKCPMETPSVRSRIRATMGPSRQRVPPAPKG